ncbi:Tn3 family transposase [Streptomyces sp. NPDC002082]|uniref:Tn3 family transposase n=1 Tax=Streptomyces sp. NPDC002082 TaxID=3154772 RepID=UPI003321E008
MSRRATHTHDSDQHSTFGSKVVVVTHREAHYVFDEILGTAIDLPSTEHATDAQGVTLVRGRRRVRGRATRRSGCRRRFAPVGRAGRG